jgi:hypothetical protein
MLIEYAVVRNIVRNPSVHRGPAPSRLRRRGHLPLASDEHAGRQSLPSPPGPHFSRLHASRQSERPNGVSEPRRYATTRRPGPVAPTAFTVSRPLASTTMLSPF